MWGEVKGGRSPPSKSHARLNIFSSSYFVSFTATGRPWGQYLTSPLMTAPATFSSSYGTSYAMVIQSMCAEEGLYGYNVNASGRRCASTVFIMIVSGIILYLVYGVGGRDLGERLEAKARRKRILNRMTGVFRRSGDSAVEEPGEQL